MADADVTSVRLPLAWSQIEPFSPKAKDPDWSSFDRAVELAAIHGLRVFPFVWGTPPWLSEFPGVEPVTPHELLAWKSFLRRAAIRYGPYGEFWSNNPELTPEPIRYWEIWNEPNIVTFGSADPEGFAKLVRASGQVLHRHRPGIEGDPRRSLRAPAAGAAQHAPRPIPLAPLPDPRRQAVVRRDRPASVRRRRRRDARSDHQPAPGDGRSTTTPSTPIYVTELGWGSDSYESRWERGLYGQASQLSLAFSMLAEPPRQLAHRRRLVVLLGRRRRAHLPVLRLRRPAHRQPRSEAGLVPLQRLDRGRPRSRPPCRVRTWTVRVGTGIAFLGHRVAHTLLR